MIIVKAEPDQFQAVREFYFDVIDGIGDSGDSVGWKKDIYPAPDFLKESICNSELFIVEEDGIIIGSMVLNHLYNDEYRKIHWPTQANDSEVMVIHALGVRPTHREKGCAKQMVQFAINYAIDKQQKAIRIDVLKGNLAAKRLYSGMGFRYIQTLQMYYEDRKSTRLNSSHPTTSRMPSSA